MAEAVTRLWLRWLHAFHVNMAFYLGRWGTWHKKRAEEIGKRLGG